MEFRALVRWPPSGRIADRFVGWIGMTVSMKPGPLTSMESEVGTLLSLRDPDAEIGILATLCFSDDVAVGDWSP